MIRGLRDEADLRYEEVLAQTNRMLTKHQVHWPVKSVFLQTAPELNYISSSNVRGMLRFKVDAEVLRQMVPESVVEALRVKGSLA